MKKKYEDKEFDAKKATEEEKLINNENLRSLLGDLFAKYDELELKLLADLINQQLQNRKVYNSRKEVLDLAVRDNPIVKKVTEMLGG